MKAKLPYIWPDFVVKLATKKKTNINQATISAIFKVPVRISQTL